MLSVLATLTAGWVAHVSHGNTREQFMGTLVLYGVNMGLMAWVAADEAFTRLTTPYVLFTAVALGAVSLLTQPLLEDDHFRYLWDGYITATTGRPFAQAPSHYFSDASLPAVMRDVLSGINNPDIPTIYGPALQALFATSYWAAPAALWPLKLWLLSATLVVVSLLRWAGVPPRWLMVLMLHPLLLKESAMTAHPDMLIGVTLLAAVLAWQRSHERLAGALGGLAVAMKVSTVVALIFFCVNRRGRFSRRGCVAMILMLCVLYAPVWMALSSTEGRAVAVFGAQWTFNPLLFKLAAALMGDAAARAACIGAFVLAWGAMFAQWVARLRRLQAHSSPALLPPIVAVFTVMLLLSPVVNPWYWLWVLPLAMLHFSVLTWVAATASLLAYAHVATQVLVGSSITTYAVPLWATAVQCLAILAAVVFSIRYSEKSITHRFTTEVPKSFQPISKLDLQ